MTQSKNMPERAGFPRPRSSTVLLALLAMALTAPAMASGQGVGYEITPVITHVRWDDQIGLRDDYLVGGRLGLRFGELVELQGYYLTRSDVSADASRVPVLPGFTPPAGQQPVRVQNYGADLRLNLLRGSVIPFVTGGGGVLRLSPEGIEASELIALKAGGGLRFQLTGGLGAEIGAETWAFRMNRFRLFSPPGAFEDPDADETRRNLALSAGLNIPLGGDLSGPTQGLRGAALTVEPMGGRLDFADDLNLDRQNLLGVRAGLELHRLVELRGFYWRGMDGDFTRAQPIHGYGGEAQFNLGSGPGVVPHLIAGAGRLDFRDGYTNALGMRPDDQTALILGTGLGFRLSDRLRATVSVRDYILGDVATDEIRRTDQLTHNLLFSAGLGFAVGGRAATPLVRDPAARTELERLRLENERLRRQAQARQTATDTVRIEVEPVIDDALAGSEVERPRRTMVVPVPEVGEVIVRFGATSDGRAPVIVRDGTVAGPAAAGLSAAEVRALVRDALREDAGIATETPTAAPPPSPAQPAAPMTAAEMRALIREVIREEVGTRPVAPVAPVAPAAAPAAAPATAEELRAIIREVIRQEVGPPPAVAPAPVAPPTGALDQRQLEAFEQRLIQRLEATLGRRLTEQERRTALLEARPDRTTVVLPPPVAAAPLPTDAADDTPLRPRHRLQPVSARAYSGAGLSDPTQVLIGGRVDLGWIRPHLPLSLVPDATVGFGDGVTSYSLAANLQYDFIPPDALRVFSPYVHGGLGLWHAGGTDLSVNFGYGVSVLARPSLTRPVRAFAEHQSTALFSRYRILLGAQLGI